MSKAKDRGAVMQFECARDRVRDYSTTPGLEKPMDRIYHMAHAAAWDTIKHGGTFVLVVSPDTITMIQRPDAEDLTTPEQTK